MKALHYQLGLVAVQSGDGFFPSQHMPLAARFSMPGVQRVEPALKLLVIPGWRH